MSKSSAGFVMGVVGWCVWCPGTRFQNVGVYVHPGEVLMGGHSTLVYTVRDNWYATL